LSFVGTTWKKPKYYDREYAVLNEALYLEPLFPFVSGAYRDYFWDDLLTYVKKNEQHLLQICRNPTTTDNIRERIFEHLIIARCLSCRIALCTRNSGIARNEFPGLEKCKIVERFQGQKLPKDLSQDGMYVPLNTNFPAIDMIWKMGKNIWFVHAHVAKHDDDVKFALEDLLEDFDWPKVVENIFLLYLSPSRDVSNSLYESLFFLDDSSSLTKVLAMPITYFACMENLPWPDSDCSAAAAKRSAKRKSDVALSSEGKRRSWLLLGGKRRSSRIAVLKP